MKTRFGISQKPDGRVNQECYADNVGKNHNQPPIPVDISIRDRFEIGRDNVVSNHVLFKYVDNIVDLKQRHNASQLIFYNAFQNSFFYQNILLNFNSSSRIHCVTKFVALLSVSCFSGLFVLLRTCSSCKPF